MNSKDVMIELRVELLRDGTIGLFRSFPSGKVNSDKVLALGILDAAKAMVLNELKPGEKP